MFPRCLLTRNGILRFYVHIHLKRRSLSGDSTCFSIFWSNSIDKGYISRTISRAKLKVSFFLCFLPSSWNIIFLNVYIKTKCIYVTAYWIQIPQQDMLTLYMGHKNDIIVPIKSLKISLVLHDFTHVTLFPQLHFKPSCSNPA